MSIYLVLDTESSVRMDTHLRVLVSVAYEVLVIDDADAVAATADATILISSSSPSSSSSLIQM